MAAMSSADVAPVAGSDNREEDSLAAAVGTGTIILSLILRLYAAARSESTYLRVPKPSNIGNWPRVKQPNIMEWVTSVSGVSSGLNQETTLYCKLRPQHLRSLSLDFR